MKAEYTMEEICNIAIYGKDKDIIEMLKNLLAGDGKIYTTTPEVTSILSSILYSMGILHRIEIFETFFEFTLDMPKNM